MNACSRWHYTLVLIFSLALTACDGSSGGGIPPVAVTPPPPPPPSSVEGSAVNSPIIDAEMRLFRFDDTGSEIEIVAGNAPVVTTADGAYSFTITSGSIEAGAGPLIARTAGGRMNGADAPMLEAVIADSTLLQSDANTLTQHLSIASSVAAALLRLQASETGAAPTTDDANTVISKVEEEFAVGLDQDPSDPTQAIAVFTRSIDQNLGLDMSPDSNNPAVNDYIEYLKLNLSSDSRKLDDMMRDPATGATVPASFNGVGTGTLASIIPGGPTAFRSISISLDKAEIENDGMDTAFLTVSLVDATGAPVNSPMANPLFVQFETTGGGLVLSRNWSSIVDGKSQINISSVWAGDAEVTVRYDLANGATAAIPVTLSIVDAVPDVADTEKPRLSSAGATSNTEVLVSFSEPMRGGMESVENPAHYRISGLDPLSLSNPDQNGSGKVDTADGGAENRTPEAQIINAELILPGRVTVRLTTYSQSDVRYEVVVTNMVDLQGNPMSPGDQFELNPNRKEFQGIPPSGDEIVDTDGDGLSDSDEQRGWIVTTVTAAGETLVFEVTSDPNNADTDGDGVTDNEEYHAASNPRSADSDGDTLTDNQEWNIIYSDPTNADTDGDGTQDGFEFYSYRTSPVLADTDGDQLSDTEEVLGRNRDPRVSDLLLHGIDIGDIRLQIDERYTFEDAQGQIVTTDSSSTVTLTHGENRSRSTIGTAFANAMLATGISGQAPSTSAGTPLGFAEVTFAGGAEVQISTESSVESQRVREESFALARELSTSSTVTREIVGARIDVDVSLSNAGDLAFTISNLEITVLERSRESTRRIIPVATLIANSELITGDPATYNLGPFTTEHGPVLFTSRDVFPNLIDELMQAPSSLVFEIANFDITDEFGRLFTFSNQTARDRTAGIIVDSGDGQIKRHLVATSLQPDPPADPGADYVPALDANFPHVGGFNSDGSPIGIPLDFALQNIMELTKNAAVADGIVAGGDQIANSTATGDDVQLIPPGTTGVSVGSIVISAGQNGILDTIPHPDDNVEVTTGYATSNTCSAASDNPRMICASNADCIDPDLPDPVGACNGPEVLKRFGSLSTGDFDRQWVVLTTGEVPAGAEFSQVVLKPGDDIYFAFVQDLDEDGVFAREEFLSGSTDSRADLFVNSSFGQVDIAGYSIGDESFELIAPVSGADGIPDSKDTDRDGLGDFAENRIGWKVSADGGLLQQVMPSPRLADSDGDGLLDPQEQDLRLFCFPPFGVGAPAGPPDDGRIDALCSFELAPVVAQSAAIAIIAGPNGVANSLAIGDDEQLFVQGVSGLTYATAVIGPGGNGILDTPLTTDDLYESTESSQRIPPATDPIRSDTDLDGVEDFPELTSFIVGKSIRDGNTVADPVAETLAIGDDVQQAFLGGPVFPGGIVVLPGPNETLESIPGGDDLRDDGMPVVADPLRRDTDADLVSDGRELALGGNPRDPDDGDEFRDSDQDGLSDTEESILGWMVSVNGGLPTLVLSNPSRPDSDFDGLPDFAERVLRTDPNKPDTDGDGLRDFDEVADFDQFFGLDVQFPGFFVDGASSRQYGTDPTNTHSDFDGLTDYFELLVGYQVLIGGEPSFRQIYTNPLVEDTDLDGVWDNQEISGVVYTPDAITDATDPDTDDDGRSDGIEYVANTNPLVPDVGVAVHMSRVTVEKLTDTGGANGAELMWWVTVQKNNNSPQLLSSALDLFSDPTSDLLPPPMVVKRYTGNGSTQCYAIYQVPEGQRGISLAVDKTINTPLKAGESITVRGMIAELDDAASDCGNPPNYIPTWMTSGCVTHFVESFSFDDFQDGGQASFPFPDGTGTVEGCEWEVEIDVRGQ